MIPQRNLSLLSNRLARKGGRRIPEAVLEMDGTTIEVEMDGTTIVVEEDGAFACNAYEVGFQEA